MKHKTFSFLAGTFLAASTFIPCCLLAQEPVERGPDGGTRYHVAGIEVLPYQGKPFTGKDSITWTRQLADGSLVTIHLYANVARDSQGHIYRERRSFVPAGSDQEPRLTETILFDAAAHTRTTCTVATRQCEITDYHPQASFTPQSVGPFANGTRYLTREDLGTKTIDDLNVVGTLEKITINPGVVGNDRPLTTTREFWYSPDLETNLAVTRDDPREGKQVIQLTELSRSEPDPAIFQTPAGYTVQDARKPVRTREP
jgi:hypothetical protein